MEQNGEHTDQKDMGQVLAATSAALIPRSMVLGQCPRNHLFICLDGTLALLVKLSLEKKILLLIHQGFFFVIDCLRTMDVWAWGLNTNMQQGLYQFAVILELEEMSNLL